MIASMREQLKQYKDKSVADKVRVSLQAFATSTKFLLPLNGILFEDTNMVRYVQFLRLPFKRIRSRIWSGQLHLQGYLFGWRGWCLRAACRGDLMNKIDPELERILVNRIMKALTKARYHPAEAVDVTAMAKKVIRPYLELPRLRCQWCHRVVVAPCHSVEQSAVCEEPDFLGPSPAVGR
jgi:hypothetical protein